MTERAADAEGLIAGYYRREPARAAGLSLFEGWPCEPVTDVRGGELTLLALPAQPGLPPRARVLDQQAAGGHAPVPHTIMPVADGPGPRSGGAGSDWFMICPPPPGPALALGTPWREQELIACVLLPAAAALAGLQARGLTHRGIRPANLFRGRAGQAAVGPVTLGPFWAAPAGTGQPAVADPPFLAWCRTPLQGDGTIADDVYALGITLLALAIGRWPLADLEPMAILRRKLALGSFTALTEGMSLPSFLADLLRGMLADDPEHRPPPSLLLDPNRAAARRASARPPRRAQRALDLGGAQAWTARELAFGLATRTEAVRLLRSGAIEPWLRHGLNDPSLAVRYEESQHSGGIDHSAPPDRTAALLLMRGIAVLEPLAPLVWRGEALWPDGLGPGLAQAEGRGASALQELIELELVGAWAIGHPRRSDGAAWQVAARQWAGHLKGRDLAEGLRRVVYGLNPLLACASPLLGRRAVHRLAELLPALDAAAQENDRQHPPFDPHVAAFIGARADQSAPPELNGLASLEGEAERRSVFRLFARLQSRLAAGPLPGLADWLHGCGFTGVKRWRSRSTRQRLASLLDAQAPSGLLTPMLAIVEDERGRAEDSAQAAGAEARMAALRTALAASERDGPARAAASRRLAQDIVTGIGLAATLGSALALAVR